MLTEVIMSQCLLFRLYRQRGEYNRVRTSWGSSRRAIGCRLVEWCISVVPRMVDSILCSNVERSKGDLREKAIVLGGYSPLLMWYKYVTSFVVPPDNIMKICEIHLLWKSAMCALSVCFQEKMRWERRRPACITGVFFNHGLPRTNGWPFFHHLLLWSNEPRKD